MIYEGWLCVPGTRSAFHVYQFHDAQDSPVGMIDACYPQVVQKKAKKEETGEGGAERKWQDNWEKKRRNQKKNKILTPT